MRNFILVVSWTQEPDPHSQVFHENQLAYGNLNCFPSRRLIKKTIKDNYNQEGYSLIVRNVIELDDDDFSEFCKD